MAQEKDPPNQKTRSLINFRVLFNHKRKSDSVQKILRLRRRRKKTNLPVTKKKANDNSDIEIIEELPETPEKELGMLNQ